MDSPLASAPRCQETLCCPSRTGDLLAAPVERELRDRDGARRTRLPARISMDWPNPIHGMLVTPGEDPFGARVARIHQLVGREQVVGRQIGLTGVERLLILVRGWGSGNLRNQVGHVILTPFGQVDLVPDPLPGALAPIADIAVVGGAQPLSHRRSLLRREATRVAVGDALLLRPDLLERLHRRQWLEPLPSLLRGRLLHTSQQVRAIVAESHRRRRAGSRPRAPSCLSAGDSRQSGPHTAHTPRERPAP